MTELREISLLNIDEPAEAHRIGMDEQALWQLADSIRDMGLLNPIIVRPTEAERYEIVAGHRRYMAHRLLQRPNILCLVREANYSETEDARFAENLQREQLSPMEEAISILRYMERTGKNAKDAARALNRSEWWVTHRISLDAMCDELKDLTHSGQLAAGAALELTKVTDESHRRYLTEFTIRSGANVGVVREWVSQWELERTRSPQAEPTRPMMPIEGQEVVVQMPCYVCHEAHDHRQMLIVRVCRKCNEQLTTNN